MQPLRILGIRETILHNQTLREYLIQWKDFPKEDASLEEEGSLYNQYPRFMLRCEHIELFKGEGCSTPTCN